jgi:hypothetical protein
MNEVRKYKKIDRWVRRQYGYRTLRFAMINILGLKDKSTKEGLEKRHELNMAELDLNILIAKLVYRLNDDKERENCKQYSIINSWLEFYSLTIDSLNNNHVDILFEIIKKIDKNKVPSK